jgi:hypothetical protein
MAAVGNVMYHSLYETNRDLYDAIMGGIHRQQTIISWQKNCIRFGIDYIFKILKVSNVSQGVVIKLIQKLQQLDTLLQ